MHVFTLASEVFASIGHYHIMVNEDMPAIHIANLAYRNNIAYDDIVWSDTINPAIRYVVYDLMAPDDRSLSMYRVTLAHKINPTSDIIVYVAAANRPSAIELVARLIMHNHSVDMYDADAELV